MDGDVRAEVDRGAVGRWFECDGRGGTVGLSWKERGESLGTRGEVTGVFQIALRQGLKVDPEEEGQQGQIYRATRETGTTKT